MSNNLIFYKMMNETEIWKDIEGYENLYQVSNLGNVRSLKRKTPKILKPFYTRGGYMRVDLRDFNKTSKKFLVHILVAKAFIPNPNNYPIINHKDENPSNNNAKNLEWCTNYYNIHYGTCIERISKALTNRKDQSKPVLQFDKNKNLLNEFPSIMEASRKTGINRKSIWYVCNERRKYAGNFVWKYKH